MAPEASGHKEQGRQRRRPQRPPPLAPRRPLSTSAGTASLPEGSYTCWGAGSHALIPRPAGVMCSPLPARLLRHQLTADSRADTVRPGR